MGTLINASAIVIATLLGIILRRFLTEQFRKSIMAVLGVGLLVLSLGWFLKDFLVVNGSSLSTRYDMVILLSLVLGTAIGEWMDIDGWFTRSVEKIENRYRLPPIAKGFISASLIFCVGTMAILGSFQEGISGDLSILLLKSTLDFVTAMMLASVLGLGVALSAFSILIYQGTLTIFSSFLAPYLAGDLLLQLSLVGNVILVAIAFNFLEIKTIKVANWLPSLLGPVVYYLLTTFI